MQCDGEPVRLGMRTTRRMSRPSQPEKQNGTLSVHTIRASGHVHRSNRPNTRLHSTTTPHIKSTLAMRELSTKDIPTGWLTRNWQRLSPYRCRQCWLTRLLGNSRVCGLQAP
jgi:hypothetical protein